MARMPYPDLDALPEEVRRFAARIDPMLNVYRMVAHAETSMYGFMKFGNALLFKTDLDPVLRELVILRVGHRCGSAYELRQHDRIARHVGVADDKIAAVADNPEDPAFTDLERRVLRFTDEVVDDVKASDATYAALAGELSHRQMAELVMMVGFYMLVCRFLENFEIELEDDAVDPLVNMGPARRGAEG